MILHKLALRLKQRGLSVWYRTSLKPDGVIWENARLAHQLFSTKMKARIMSVLKDKVYETKTKFSIKQASVRQLMGVCRRNEGCSMKWYFDLWLIRSKLYKTRCSMVRKLLNRREAEQKRAAMLTWHIYSDEVMEQCRHVLMKRMFTQELLR